MSSRLKRTFELHVDAFRETYGMSTAAGLLVDAAVVAACAYGWFAASGAVRWLALLPALFIVGHRLFSAAREVRG